nr:MAG TPA: hypothetical protein [Caudoviricetes sp.]DAT52002.1 MAG TPA: hypothetical protein [Caudoviricetes sp.]
MAYLYHRDMLRKKAIIVPFFYSSKKGTQSR